MLIAFIDCYEVVYHEFLTQGQTVDKEFYMDFFKAFTEDLRWKRPELWGNKNWILHHINTPSHASLLVDQFLANEGRAILPCPLYSSDLASVVFFYFLK